MAKARLAILALGALLSGCSGGWLPWGNSGREQPQRLPEGATELACAQGKRLVVRYTADGKSAWVLLPDREFRLDRVAQGGAERYANGPNALSIEGDGIALDIDGARQFSDCRKKP